MVISLKNKMANMPHIFLSQHTSSREILRNTSFYSSQAIATANVRNKPISSR